jgi:hypothetical protein
VQEDKKTGTLKQKMKTGKQESTINAAEGEEDLKQRGGIKYVFNTYRS